MDIFKVNEETCTKCGACADVCHVGIIDFQKGEYPQAFPVAENFCSKCGACMIVCPTDSFMHRDITYEECPPVDVNFNVSYEQCAQLIKNRRSIRLFKNTPVPRENIERAIDTARYSPTGMNMQNVQWLVIDDKDKIESFRKIGNEWELGLFKNNPNFAPLADIWQQRNESGVDDFLHGAPVIVSTFAEKDMQGAEPVCSIALAYFDLAAISLGLGCCWDGFFNGAANNFPPIKDAIALPEGYQIYGSLAVGYPKYEHLRIPMRNPARIIWQ